MIQGIEKKYSSCIMIAQQEKENPMTAERKESKKDEKTRTIRSAIRSGDTALLFSLLDAESLGAVVDDEGNTPLLHAARFGKTACLELLVEAGADVNATANMYGGGSMVLGLPVTSDHPAKAGVTGDARKVLEAAGAKRD